jgi:hypothetical protein
MYCGLERLTTSPTAKSIVPSKSKEIGAPSPADWILVIL